MSKIKVSLDNVEYWEKPQGKDIARIHNQLGSSVKEINPTQADINQFTLDVGRDGHTFCTATFRDGKRSKDNFEQQQMFALDFDNKAPDRRVSLEDVKARAEKYGLPVLFAYDTFSSTKHDKFRVVFLNDAPITNRKIAEAMQLAMGTIFPEADPSCYRDVSRLYFGGKERLYYDDTIPTINIDTVVRGLTYHLKDTKRNHYKDQLAVFSKETGIALNKNGLLDVTVMNDLTETPGAIPSNQDGKISPSSITCISNIIANGENFPTKYYRINLSDSTNQSSVTTSVSRTDVVIKEYKNHNPYRKSDIQRMGLVCRLFSEFESGSRDMKHDELFGILTNLMCVDSGITSFKEIQAKYPNFYDRDRRTAWERHISYNKLQGYRPSSCDGFCPYRKECNHGKNILSTVRPRLGMMERIPGYKEEFSSLEDVQEDTFQAIRSALYAEDNQIHVIKAMTGAGKSYSYLKLMAEHPEHHFEIAASTNLLKNEIYHKAIQMGIEVRRTPSLEEIKLEMPSDVWNTIQHFRKSGQHHLVHSYISELLKKRRIPCLEKYMQEREALKTYSGNLFTTHRYLLNMDEKRLKDFDAVIIDEDILFKSIIPNQEAIPVSALKKLSVETTDSRLTKKIEDLLKLAEDQSRIELDGLEWDDENDEGNDLPPYDLPSFYRAEQFYVRRSSKEPNLAEDTIVFLKLPVFRDMKYIVVSATANEAIYRQYFGEDRVEFHECKRAEYMGTLNQYPGKSMSRSSIASDPGVVRRLMKRFDMSEDRVISFMREKIGHLHFGNTEGSNILEGKDILVVGTPYHADFLYKLVALTMGLDFDEDEEVSPQGVTHNGYRFRFTTFKDEGLRAIQFWMIESELEQAVGRARLLRNSCEVHLFSNLPLSQAKMVEGFDYDKE